MNGEPDKHHSPGPEDDLEQRVGLPNALYSLWSPEGRAVALGWDDSHIVIADQRTRYRFIQTHVVIHAMLHGDDAKALSHLNRTGRLMPVFTALRALTLTSELLWTHRRAAWDAVLLAARSRTAAMPTSSLQSNEDECKAGARRLDRIIRDNIGGSRRQTILDCIVAAASGEARPARVGLGYYGAAAYVAALESTSERTRDELLEEHAALLIALSDGETMTHRGNHIVLRDQCT